MHTDTPSPFLVVVSKLLSVAPHEAGRVALAWTIKMLLFTGQTIGWTMLTALLVIQQGIASLPILYVASAGLMIISTLIFTELSSLLTVRRSLFVTILSGVACLVIAALALHGVEHFIGFFIAALIAYGVFFTQLKIHIGLFIEHLFSPLESERVFPIIETSEYVGGILGGVTVVCAIQFLHLEPDALTLFWGAALLAIAPLIALFYARAKKLPGLTMHKKTHERPTFFSGAASRGFQELRRIPFVKGLAIFVLMQSLLITLVNYQLTSAVDSSAGGHGTSHATAETHEAAPAASSAPLHASAEVAKKYEHILTENLGQLHMLFSFSALLFQLFITSRMLRRFGIVRTMQAHPILSGLASLPFIFVPTLPTAAALKGVAEVTGGAFFAGYHASLYTIPEDIRRTAKEYIDGIAYPLGAVIGTLTLLAAEYLLHAASIPIVALATGGGFLLMALLMLPLARHYTLCSKKALDLSGDHPDKLNAIEILSQKGHADAALLLVRNLTLRRESPEMKIHILETLGRIRALSAVPDILSTLKDPSALVRLSAVQALSSFGDLQHSFTEQAFTRHRIVSSLQELFRTENSKELRSHIVRVFANLRDPDIVPFLIEALGNEDPETKADSIFVCGLFHDISVAHYLEPYLTHEHPFVRGSSIIALWQFPQYRLRLTIQLTTFMESKDLIEQRALAHVLGEIGAIQEKPRLMHYLESSDPELRLLAALALAKMDHADAPDIIADFILHEDAELARRAKKQVGLLSPVLKKRIEEKVHHKLSHQLSDLITDIEASSLEEISPEILRKLYAIYSMAGEHDEAAKIQLLMR